MAYRQIKTSYCRIGLLALVCALSITASVQAGTLYDIDRWHGDPRKIPDVNGQPGDSITLADSQIIDILILGDGFLQNDTSLFLSSSSSSGANGWWNTVFGENGESGLRPFSTFRQAFRVWALFEPSAERISQNRGSHYRIALTTDSEQIGKGSWWTDTLSEANFGFRDSLFKSIDELADSLNVRQYPEVLGGENDPSGDYNLRYRNLYIVMLARADSAGPPDSGDSYRPSGRSFAAPRVAQVHPTQWVKIGVASGEVHEWGHTFGYLKDEYIDGLNDTASQSNPAIQSLWNLHNMTYGNARCDLPWKHLAPGGKYNPKIRSLIGNLWMGSSAGLYGNWHSEYKCQINGTHENYTCDFGSPPVDLRDTDHYCFWCEEMMTTRILERVGEFDRLDPAPVAWNDQGIQWFNYWDQTLRDKYYTLFNYDSLIAVKNQCYDLWSNKNTCTDCDNACDTVPLPICLPSCDIREIGNGIYTDPGGFPVNPGTKELPVQNLTQGITLAQILCSGTPIVVVRPGVQPGPITITDPVFLITDECGTVLLGK
jgi:hypothetical protein